MRLIGILIALVIILIGVVFAALNANSVEVNYLIGTKSLPLAVMLLIAVTLGILLSIIILGFTVLKLKAKNSWLENKLKHSQEALSKIQYDSSTEKP